MRKNFQVNTAILICTAFIFRLLFIHAGAISVPGQQSQSQLQKAQSAALVQKRHSELSNHSDNREYALVEVFTEDPDENELKSKIYPFRQLLYDLVSSETEGSLNHTCAFYESFSYGSNHRYIAMQVFRI